MIISVLRHGTGNAYQNHRCRCDYCKAWARDHQLALRRKRMQQPIPRSVQHGTLATYQNWDCRCEPCRAAASTYQKKRYRERLRERQAVSS